MAEDHLQTLESTDKLHDVLLTRPRGVVLWLIMTVIAVFIALKTTFSAASADVTTFMSWVFVIILVIMFFVSLVFTVIRHIAENPDEEMLDGYDDNQLAEVVRNRAERSGLSK